MSIREEDKRAKLKEQLMLAHCDSALCLLQACAAFSAALYFASRAGWLNAAA